MKLLIKENEIPTYKNLLEPWLTKALLKVDGYNIERLGLTIPSKDVTVAEFLSFIPIAKGYEGFSIWIEVPIALNDNNIPAAFSFSTYQDEDDITVQRKISDMTISASGVTNNIRYLQSITSKITVADLNAIVINSNVTPLSISERNALVKDTQGEYYIDSGI